jgi:hypothetical protein
MGVILENMCDYINNNTTDALKMFYSKMLHINNDIVNIFDTGVNVLLLFVQLLFIIAIILFSFTKDNISILGGWTKFAYVIILVTILIKVLLTFRKYYITDSPEIEQEKTFDNEVKFYESIYKLFINMPSDIPFIVLLSITLSSLSIITSDNSVSKNFSFTILSILVPVFITFLILLLLRKYLVASKMMYGNIFFILVYIVVYYILISIINIGLKPIMATLFTKIENLDEEDEENITNISENLKKKFLIFSDPSPLYDEDSAYYYILGLIFYIILILSQVGITYLFTIRSNVNTLKFIFKIIIDKIFTYLELPLTKKNILLFQKEKIEKNLQKIIKDLAKI